MSTWGETRRVVSVFLASPGDLKRERELAFEVVEEFNKNWARELAMMVELVVWEDTVGEKGRPQDIINRDQLERCEIFVGMLHRRWGTPTGNYSSGFEEEFDLAEKSYSEHNRPYISMLFKNVDPESLRQPTEDLSKVLQFKSENGQRILYHEFDGDTDFKMWLNRIITKHVQRLWNTESSASKLTQFQPIVFENESEKGSDNPHLPEEAQGFLKSFIGVLGQSKDTSSISRIDSARLRLITSLVSPNLDEQKIGVHDSNLLFEQRKTLKLSKREQVALFRSGIARFDSENTPIWYWLSQLEGFAGTFVEISSLFGSTAERVGAIRLLTVMEKRELGDEQFDRRMFIEEWLSPFAHHSIRNAALSYLRNFGQESDLDLLKQEVERADYQTKRLATEVYLELLSNHDCEGALSTLIAIDPENVSAETAARIFRHPDQIPTHTLVSATNTRAALIRANAITSLSKKNVLSKELAEELSTDSDPTVRFSALSSRLKMGETITEATAEEILVKSSANRQNALGGFIGFAPLLKEGTEELERFKRELIGRIPISELRERAPVASIFDQHLAFELIKRNFDARGDELRVALADQFKTWFKKELQKVTELGINSETLSKIEKLEETLRKEWVRIAADILVEADNPRDMLLIRKIINSDFVQTEASDIEFLAKHGEWSDLPTVLEFNDKSSQGIRSPLLSMRTGDETAQLSKNLIRLGAERLGDLLDKDIPNDVKAQILKQVSAKYFKELSNEFLMTLLQDKSDEIRRNCVLRIVSDLPKTRTKKIFELHMALTEDRFYNVSLWLDLGVSALARDAKRIAHIAL